jgi:lipoprotein-releasing system ATP-binding protein
MDQPILIAENISKSFKSIDMVPVLHNISFGISKGEFTSIIGKSGCGKSTLLYILSTMDSDFTGRLFIDGEDMADKTEKELANIRNKKIGFVFQFHYLLNEFTVLKNIMLPALRLGQFSESEIAQRASAKLEQFGIASLAAKRANQLSGGEKQRVAIARAMINDPAIIMADEPTGNLDKRNSAIVFDALRQLSEDYNQTLLIVTHDMEFAKSTNRMIEMEDGRIINSSISRKDQDM